MDVFRQYPLGAIWVERMRFAGYEPRVVGYREKMKIFAKAQGSQRDKEVFALIANDVDTPGRLRDEVAQYLRAT